MLVHAALEACFATNNQQQGGMQLTNEATKTNVMLAFTAAFIVNITRSSGSAARTLVALAFLTSL